MVERAVQGRQPQFKFNRAVAARMGIVLGVGAAGVAIKVIFFPQWGSTSPLVRNLPIFFLMLCTRWVLAPGRAAAAKARIAKERV
jgi:hypothetical protein